jgi:hypothetical protein
VLIIRGPVDATIFTLCVVVVVIGFALIDLWRRR